MKTKAPNALAFGGLLGKRRALTNDSKEYYEWDAQVIYEDPAPGNKAGGIPAPEEKSFGCV